MLPPATSTTTNVVEFQEIVPSASGLSVGILYALTRTLPIGTLAFMA